MTFLPRLIELLTEFLGPDAPAIHAHTRLDELGMDSLATLRFARKAQEALGTRIDLEDLFDCPSVGALAERLGTMGDPATSQR